MKHWKIGTRIVAGFAAVILIAAGLGIFAIDRAGEVRKKTDELASNYFPSVIALSVVNANIHQSVADLLQLIISTDANEIARLKAEIVSLRAENKKQLDFYESTPFTPEEARVYAEFVDRRNTFWQVFDEIEKQGESTDPTAVAKAEKLFAEQLTAPYAADTAAIERLVEMNRKGANEGMASIGDSVAASRRGILIGLLLAVALSVPIAFAIVRGITRPLALAVETLDRVAGGDLTATLDVDTKDEVGLMARALNEALDKLRIALLGVAETAVSTNTASLELSSATEAIASGAQEQAASLEQTSASLEQITATVRQTADNAGEASLLGAGDGQRGDGQRGDGQRGDGPGGQSAASAASAVSAMQDVSAASAKIEAIISTVDEIAFQTNLLAINAAIEAARAGEEGRGFAVVATEVRSLSQRSAVAAKEIKGLIQDTLAKVASGSELVERVTRLVSAIASATAEQSTGLNQVNTAVNQMDQVTQSNATQTEELSATAQSLAEQSQRLTELVSKFTLDRRQGSPGGPAKEPFAGHRVKRAAGRDAKGPAAGSRAGLAGSMFAKRGGAGAAISVSAGKKTRFSPGEAGPREASFATGTDANFEEF